MKSNFTAYVYKEFKISKPFKCYRLDNQGGQELSPSRLKNFHFSISSRPALGSTHSPIKWVPVVKRQGREADHSPPTSAEVKKMWIYTSTPPYVFMA
jgi:hypothetical protein